MARPRARRERRHDLERPRVALISDLTDRSPKTWLTARFRLNRGVPLRIRRGPRQMAVQIRCAVRPPNRATFAERHLGALDSSPGFGPHGQRRLPTQVPPSRHELGHQALPLRLREVGIRRAPQASSDHEVPAVRSTAARRLRPATGVVGIQTSLHETLVPSRSAWTARRYRYSCPLRRLAAGRLLTHALHDRARRLAHPPTVPVQHGDYPSRKESDRYLGRCHASGWHGS